MSAANALARWQRREAAWCLLANRWGRQRWVHRSFAAISRLGDGPAWYALMFGVVLLDGWNGLLASTHMAATALVALTLYRLLKRRTRRPRPYARDGRIRALTHALDEYSFPSGHTLHAVAFTLIAVAWYPALTWLLAPFSAAIAVSRVVLGLHYPTDVLAALALGSGLAGMSLLLVG